MIVTLQKKAQTIMKTIDEDIIYLKETPSTNDFLLTHNKEHKNGTVVLTDSQTAGKGLGKNKWESEEGKNLTLSVLLRPENIKSDEQFNLNMATSLAIRRFIQKFTTASITVKWPNDIYAGNKKIAGILIKNFLYGSSIERSIIGIGININQERFYSDAPNPVSLKQLTGRDYDLKQLLDVLLSLLDAYFETLSDRYFDSLNKEYYKYLYQLNEWHDYLIHNQHVKAYIQGIDEFGQLTLTDKQGRIYVCGLKEIEFLLDS